ncbi:serine-rich adhesin for platelets [Eurosta solidaginis]|uniref:serine-rich adhesin for platelets n=1 Tax=Eurosta solidaginis TaxID=178769 RepID=UPI0035309F21
MQDITSNISPPLQPTPAHSAADDTNNTNSVRQQQQQQEQLQLQKQPLLRQSHTPTQPPAELLLIEQKQQQQKQQHQKQQTCQTASFPNHNSNSTTTTSTTTNTPTTPSTPLTPTTIPPQIPANYPTKAFTTSPYGNANPITNSPQRTVAPLPLRQQNPKVITRSQSSKVIQELKQLHSNNNNNYNNHYQQQQQHHSIPQLKQQQSLPATLHPPQSAVNGHHNPPPSKSVSILVYKTLNTVFKSSRKIIVRVCEVASAKKSFTMFKFNKAAAQNRAENRANACTGHDQFVRPPVPEKKVKHIMKKLHKQNGLKRSNSAIEFDVSALTAANRRHIYSSNRSASSEQDNSDQSEHSEKSPLVSARPNLKYQYSALDSGNGIVERSPRERAQRERAFNTLQEWVQNSNGRYEIIAHLDEMGSRHGKNWFLVTDATVRTDRLLTLLQLPTDCVAFEDLPSNENPKPMLMELLGSLHHPYIYPILDLGFLQLNSSNFACLVTPFNSRGSLKDLIYRAQWNEPWARKYTRKPNGLPVSQVQRLGRQILEALLFLKERGFPLHGHLHSGNVILQNGAARLSGLENGLLGLSSRVNAVMWSRSTTEIENVDIICFGHLLYEMCTGQEMTTPKPSMRVLEMELDNFPQILDVLGLIFEPPSGVCPSVEDLVLCDLFRSIDLRELRGPCFSTIKPSLSRSTLNLLYAVKKRQCTSLGSSLSEMSSPSTPPSTPRDGRRGFSRTMDSFDISSDSEEGLLDEVLVNGNYHQKQRLQQLQRMQNYHQRQHHSYPQHYYGEFMEFSSRHQHQHPQYKRTQYFDQSSKTLEYETIESSPLHYCENTTTQSDDNIYSTQEEQQLTPYENQKQIESPKSTPLAQPSPPSVPALQLPTIHCSSSNNLNAPTMGTSSATGRSSGSSTSIASICGDGACISATASPPATFIVQQYNDDTTSENTIQPGQLEVEGDESTSNNDSSSASSETAGVGAHQVVDTSSISPSFTMTDDDSAQASTSAAAAAAANLATAGASFNHQLTADMCNYKNSKSRRLEYSLKCLKYGRSNPSQDSAFGSLTDNDFSVGSTSFRINSFQSISSPIDEGVEDVIIATTTGGKETCLELATIPRSMVSQDSAISSPCRESSPSNFLHIDDAMSGSCSGASTSSGGSAGVGHIRPQQFPVSLSPKILVTATTNSSNSSLSSSSAALPQHNTQQQQQFDPPKILVNDQNSIYTTSPSKRNGTIEVFSQKYRVSSFEDMSPNKRSSAASDKLLKNVNRMAFRSLEEERRIDSAFMPIVDRTNSENRVNNMQRDEKYKKLTHSSFRISKTSSQVVVYDSGSSEVIDSTSPLGNASIITSIDELQRPATASGSISSRQTLWRDSKFYRKNRIAKSNDSLLETSPNHSARLSPSSLRDNHYDSSSSYGSRSHSRQSLNHGSSINEIVALNAGYGGFGSASGGSGGQGLSVTTSFCNNVGSAGAGRRYCSSKSEDLADSNDYLRVMDTRKSYSERHLVTLTKLKQTAINNTTNNEREQYCASEDGMSLYDDNNVYGYVYFPEQQQHKQQYHQHHAIKQQQQQHRQQQQTQHRRNAHFHQQPQANPTMQKQQQQIQKKQHIHHQQQQQKQQNQTHQQQPKRPHPNQFSWSSCSINRLRTSNIKTTSLATLSCHENLIYSASAHPPPNTASSNTVVGDTITALPHVSRSSFFKSVDHFVNLTERHNGGSDIDASSGGSGTSASVATDYNSSPDESPAHQTLSAAELSKMFAMHDAQGSQCSEEKIPLLDSVEMSPISPTEPEELLNDEKM